MTWKRRGRPCAPPTFRFEEKELVNVLLENRAGELTGLAAKLADARLNLEAAYVVGLAGDMIELAIAVDDVKKAKKLLGMTAKNGPKSCLGESRRADCQSVRKWWTD
jgi:hypothetical protein